MIDVAHDCILLLFQEEYMDIQLVIGNTIYAFPF